MQAGLMVMMMVKKRRVFVVICTHYTACIALFLSLCLKTETQGKTDVVIISNNIHTQCSSKTVAVLRNFFAVVSLNTFI